jgi:hypothetical protein
MLFLAALAAVALALPAGADDKKPAEAAKLFNGTDLTGWTIFIDPKAKGVTPADVWSVKDGVLRCKGEPNGYLLTEKDHGNYVLTVEWRWPGKAGNSGVFVHVSGPDKIWPKGVEAQLFSGHAGDFWLVGGFKLDVAKERQDKKTPRHYNRMKTDKPVEKKPGEWNKYEITCKGDTIKLVVNEGTKAEATRGKILLQSEGTPIEFRNVTLTPLPKGK